MQYLKKEVRERILDASIDEFTAQGFTNASIRNIAQIAGISLGNVYRYFTGKDALYLALVQPVLSEGVKRIDMLFGFNKENFEKLPVVVTDYMNDYKVMLAIVNKGTYEQYNSFVSVIVNSVAENLRNCIGEKYPELVSKIKNSSFYEAVASGFVNGLLVIIHGDGDDAQKQKNIKELLIYFFNKIDVRFDKYY